ncbi:MULTISPECIES: DUF1657 domain-containing protein [Bacillus]|uniref:DUF1657 domain-containing protein n=3 Tax=Bacillus cereus group TaxID=86661 RepID=A0ABD6R9K8_BACTU|nr:MULTISPECIES: DUF1657 domain-containing protein [Bacillus]MCO4216360.1 DUF1657 domain-containing protein [Bacillus sp. 10017]MCX2703095.1 DUF1657 domain-containing protein [Bacillus sp. AS_5]WIL49988.1 DUF1657 domain-containing protein [Bacillus bombysepticus]AHA72096.1 hypothetical protein YBT1518_14640 [Bacillus thuringiensis YBT-1518]EKS8367040.1 DUF1657 domain-containing protein [Bacillus cereus]
MTVITKLKQTISGLKSAQACLEGFALDTDNQQAKQLYQNAAQQAQTIIDSLEPRVQEVQQDEPQYKQ